MLRNLLVVVTFGLLISNSLLASDISDQTARLPGPYDIQFRLQGLCISSVHADPSCIDMACRRVFDVQEFKIDPL